VRFRPERPASAAGRRRATAVLLALAATASIAGGCGKGEFRAGASTAASRTVPPGPSRVPRERAPRRRQPPQAKGVSVPLPLPLNASRAVAFARAVTLHLADLPGAVSTPKSKSSAAQEREAARCGGRTTVALGGGSSPDFHRGAGLNRESFSSSVQVLGDATAVRGDLAYASSHAGLACYAKILGKSLGDEQDTHVRVRGVRVGRIGVAVGPSEQASGIRVTADVAIVGTRVQVRLFIDALSLPYGPAELDVYSTSFVQPAPERTERELLELLRERAQLQKL